MLYCIIINSFQEFNYVQNETQLTIKVLIKAPLKKIEIFKRDEFHKILLTNSLSVQPD